MPLNHQALQRTYHSRSVRPPAQLQDHLELVAGRWQRPVQVRLAPTARKTQRGTTGGEIHD